MIAITGGTGFIGQWILRLYSNRYKFRVLTRNLVQNDEVYRNGNIEYCATDYSEESLKEILKDCDSLIHLAAIRFDKNNKETLSRYLDNIVLAENLFSISNDLGIKNIVFLSSRAVYENDKKEFCKEDEVTRPMNLYGISKVTIELLSQYYNDKYDMNIKSLRIAQVLGLGEREGYMFNVFLNSCIEKKTITLYGEGKGERNYIYVKDLCRAIITALEKRDDKEIYNIAGSRTVSHKELAETMCEIFNNENNIVFLKDKKEDTSIQRISIEKAKRNLGFVCEYDLTDMMNDMKNILQKVDNENEDIKK